jgi:hypothetical protein
MARTLEASTTMANVIGVMTAAGGPPSFLVTAMYPLHLAIHHLFADPHGPHFGEQLETTPVADIGLAITGVGEGLYDLLASGTLYLTGSPAGPRFATDADRLRRPRSHLMRMEPEAAESYRRAGLLWLACTSRLENMVRRSDQTEAVVEVTSPSRGMRRQGPLGASC